MAENAIIHSRKLTIEQKNTMTEVTFVWVRVTEEEENNVKKYSRTENTCGKLYFVFLIKCYKKNKTTILFYF